MALDLSQLINPGNLMSGQAFTQGIPGFSPPQIGLPPGVAPDTQYTLGLADINRSLASTFAGLAGFTQLAQDDFGIQQQAIAASTAAAQRAAAAASAAAQSRLQSATEQAAHDTSDVDRLLGYSQADQQTALTRLAQQRGWSDQEKQAAEDHLATLRRYASEDFQTNRDALARQGIYNQQDYETALGNLARQRSYTSEDFGTVQSNIARQSGYAGQDLQTALEQIGHDLPLALRGQTEANNKAGLLYSGRGQDALSELARKYGLQANAALTSYGRGEDERAAALRAATTAATRQNTATDASQQAATTALEREQTAQGVAGQALATQYARTGEGYDESQATLARQYAQQQQGYTNQVFDINQTGTRAGENATSQKEAISLGLTATQRETAAQQAQAQAEAASASAEGAARLAAAHNDYDKTLFGYWNQGQSQFSDAQSGVANLGIDWANRVAQAPAAAPVQLGAATSPSAPLQSSSIDPYMLQQIQKIKAGSY